MLSTRRTTFQQPLAEALESITPPTTEVIIEEERISEIIQKPMTKEDIKEDVAAKETKKDVEEVKMVVVGAKQVKKDANVTANLPTNQSKIDKQPERRTMTKGTDKRIPEAAVTQKIGNILGVQRNQRKDTKPKKKNKIVVIRKK